MIYIFDRDENLLKILNDDEIEEFECNVKLNSERSINFIINNEEHIRRYNKVGFFDKDDKFQLFFIDDFKKHIDIDSCTIQVTCLADFYSLNNSIIEDKRIRSGSATEALTKTLENSNYRVGVVESFENQDISFYFISKLKALNKILETYNCEFDIRVEINEETGNIGNKYIDLKHRLGQDTALRFTYDTALNYIEKSVITEGHFNVLYGRGKSLETDEGGYSRKLTFENVNSGKKYVEDQESIKKYGRLEGIYENDNIEDENVLLEKTKEALKTTKEVKFSYSASVKDLSKFTGFEHYKYMLGDSILIIDEDQDIIIESRIIEINESKEDTVITLSNFQNGLFDNDVNDQIDNIKDKIDNVANGEIDESKYPNTLPNVPVLSAKGLFATVSLEWTFENKSYYTYEVYASQIKDFNPSIFDKIYEGKASAFLHEVKPKQTWYYRCRVKNTHNKYTNFSQQIEAHTLKIADGTEYFENAAINDAIIGELRLDRGWVGRLVGTYIDARNLSVTDGNGNRTLDIDSFGNVSLNVKALNINSREVATVNDINDLETSTNEKISNIEQTSEKITQSVGKVEGDVRENSNKITIAEGKLTADGIFNTVKNKISGLSGSNLIKNSKGRLGHKNWNVYRHGGSGVVINESYNTIDNSRYALQFAIKNNIGTRGGLLSHSIPVRENTKYTLTAEMTTHRGDVIIAEGMCWDKIVDVANITPNVKKIHIGVMRDSQITSLTFTTPPGTKFMNIYLWGEYISSSTTWNFAHYWIKDLRLNEGEIPHPWCESNTFSESSISQLADEVDIKVDKNGIIHSINVSGEGVKIDANKIYLNGYVTVSQLGSDEKTVINNAEIFSGKIYGSTMIALNGRNGQGILTVNGGDTYVEYFRCTDAWRLGNNGFKMPFVYSSYGIRNNEYASDMINKINFYGVTDNNQWLQLDNTFTNRTEWIRLDPDYYSNFNNNIYKNRTIDVIQKFKEIKFLDAETIFKSNITSNSQNILDLETVDPAWLELIGDTEKKKLNLDKVVTDLIKIVQKQQSEIESLKNLNSNLNQRRSLVSSTYFKIKKIITERVMKCS